MEPIGETLKVRVGQWMHMALRCRARISTPFPDDQRYRASAMSRARKGELAVADDLHIINVGPTGDADPKQNLPQTRPEMSWRAHTLQEYLARTGDLPSQLSRSKSGHQFATRFATMLHCLERLAVVFRLVLVVC